MKHRLLPAIFVTLSVSWSAQLQAAQSNGHDCPTKRLNVLFLVSDDLRPELGCYGNEQIKSPNIDKLAERGMVLHRAYCQQAVCSPSRTSVLTGTRPDTNRVWDLRTHFREAMPNVVTLPQLFKQHGYESIGLGKIYHSRLDDKLSWSETARAFLTNDGDGLSVRRRLPANRRGTRVHRFTAVPSEWANRLTQTDRGPAFRVTTDNPHSGGEAKLADQAIAALRKLQAGSAPFFLGVGFHKPHLPFRVPEHYWNLYSLKQIPLAPNAFLPRNAPDYALADKNELWKYSGVPDVSDLPDWYARQLKHGYYAAVSYMDAQLGRVLNELDSLGLRDSTIVILWGDHGWKLGEHRRWCKHSNVEDDARAPLIIAVPGERDTAQHTEALVEFVDIYPTLAELANIPLPDHLEGTSLRPLLEDPEQTWKSAAFSQYPRTVKGRKLMGYSMRTDRYRFTRWVDREDHSKVNALELYDHQVDPQENTNIAGKPANNELVYTLTRQLLAGWRGALPAK